MNAKATFASALSALAMLGCSSLETTGSFGRDQAKISRYQSAYFSEDAGDFDEKLEQKHMTTIARVLERNGLKIVDKRNGPNVLVCKAGIKSKMPFGKGVHISLWDGGEMVFAAELYSGSLRLGIDGGVQRLVEATLDRLDRELIRNRAQATR